MAVDAMMLGYNAAGKVSVVRDGLGLETSFTYDDLQRVTTVQGPAASDVIHFGYDAAGDRTVVQDPTGYSFYSYDAFGRVLTATRSLDSGVTGSANGIWEYSIDGGTTWASLNSVTPSKAILLSADDLIRFRRRRPTSLAQRR